MTEWERLHQSAAWAKDVLSRVSGIAAQIAGGEWDNQLTSERASDLADSLAELAEVVRAGRSAAGSASLDIEPTPQWSGLLPFNRKERFFTGTVFPGLVGSTGFWHLQRCLDLFGVPVQVQGGEFAEVQFLTEYGFAESVFTDADRAKWGTHFTRETPDIVILGKDWLLANRSESVPQPDGRSS
jgi:hypothetical protein